MKISNEFKVGIITILALLLLFWGFNYLKGNNLFENDRTFYAVYERVDGLSSSRPVMVNGLKVGQVKSVYFHPDGSGRLMVKMAMENDIQISRNTIARISSSDLLGDKMIDFALGDDPNPAKSGDTLSSEIQLSLADEVNKQVAPLKDKAEKLIGSIDTVLILVSGFLNNETKDNFYKTFTSLRRTFQNLESTVKSVDETVTASQEDIVTTVRNVASIAKNLEDNNEELSAIFKNFETISDSLARVNFAQTFATLNKAVTAANEALDKINTGEGTAGKLLNDPAVYNNLEDASEQLNRLILDIKYNPARYVNFSVFGKKQTYSDAEIDQMEAERKKNEKPKDEK